MESKIEYNNYETIRIRTEIHILILKWFNIYNFIYLLESL